LGFLAYTNLGMTRRDLIRQGAFGFGAMIAPSWIPLSIEPAKRKPLRLAVITDLHHGLAPDAMSRLRTFATEVRRRDNFDIVIQMGDFCYSQPDSADCIRTFKDLPHPKLHVLGNHDMDKCDKAIAMAHVGMPSRYGAYDVGDYRFVVLDLNHFKKDGKLFDYANGNYFTDNATHNWADPEQLDWLAKELRHSKKPVILFCHQPLGFAEPGQPIPPEQVEVLTVITDAKKENPHGAVSVCLFGHLHVDRLEHYAGIPCLCVNSASYFWGDGMYPYSKPLFSFMEITADGRLIIEGVQANFVKPPPQSSDKVIGRSASISDRDLRLHS
jgi:predicted phosphodiesterase